MVINLDLVIILSLLGLAAFFSASEASLLSLNRAQLEGLRVRRPSQYRLIRNLIFRPEHLLSTLIIGNECINILLSGKITYWVENSFPQWNTLSKVMLSVSVSSLLLLTFSEILPKTFGFRLPELLAPALVVPLHLVHRLLSPVRKLFLKVSQGLLTLLGMRHSYPTAINEKDFLYLVEEGAQSGSLDREERELIFNVFSFSDLSVSHIMTPWEKVFYVDDAVTLEDLLSRIRSTVYSRIPVLEKKSSQVMGVLHTKQLFPAILRGQSATEPFEVRKFVFPAFIVTSHLKISKLFRDFKKKKIHMALVVDEFGKFLGLVTLEDVLSAIFRTK